MIAIDVQIWPLVSEIFGGDKTKRVLITVEIEENKQVSDLILALCAREPMFRKYFTIVDNRVVRGLEFVSVVLNDNVITSQEGFNFKLKNGDRVGIVQGFTGG
jgi:molybdopterin converting factor small subunit